MLTQSPSLDAPSYGDDTKARSSPARRIPSLDGLRGLSILAVMLAHAVSHFGGNSHFTHRVLDFVSPLAYLGVTLFFVISGFLITSLLLKEMSNSGRISLARFYRRRAARILPASLVYTIAIVLVVRVSFQQALYAFTFTTSYFFDQSSIALQQLWSLSVEEQFYLLWPLVFWRGLPAAKNWCWVIVVLSPLIRLTLMSHGFAQTAHLAPAIGDSIAFGCLLAFYQDPVRRWVAKYLGSGYALLAACFIVAGIAGPLYRYNLVFLWGLIPASLTLIIAAAIRRRDKVLNTGPLPWLGLFSYSLYLWQQPFLVLPGPVDHVVPRLLLTLFFAYSSYRMIEQPALRLFSAPLEKQGTAAATA